MTHVSYGRVSDLNGLPELIVRKAGEDGLHYALERQAIAPDALDKPEATIPMRDIIGLYRTAAEVTGLRSFGLDVARNLDPHKLGAGSEHVMQADTLGDALFRFRKVLPYYESGSRITLHEAGDEFIVGYQNLYQGSAGFRHAGDMTIRIFEALIRVFLGDDWQPRRIVTCGAKGPWEHDYEDAFQAPVAFRADRLALVVDRDLLARPNRQPEISAGDVVTFADVRRQGLDLPHDFVGAVARIIELGLASGHVGLDDSASKLGIGLRTLQRRLAEHGIGHRQLVKQCRMRRACELLTESSVTIERISQELGYSTTAHFTRAFSREQEITPSQFRVAYSLSPPGPHVHH